MYAWDFLGNYLNTEGLTRSWDIPWTNGRRVRTCLTRNT